MTSQLLISNLPIYHHAPINQCIYHPQQKYLACSVALDKKLVLYDTNNNKLQNKTHTHILQQIKTNCTCKMMYLLYYELRSFLDVFFSFF